MFVAYLMTFSLFVGCYYITKVIIDKMKDTEKEELKQLGM